MTTMTFAPGLARPARDRFRLARRITGYAAIAGTLPYLTLKLAWLTGDDVGVLDPAFMHDRTIFALNLFTAGMDLYAILLALTFAHVWRMWPPLVLFPIWVGTGFLAPIVAGLPIVAVVTAIAGSGKHASTAATVPLESWVQPLVYTGFAWQGVCLLTGFLLYAATRWRPALTTRLTDARTPLTPIGYAGAALAGVTAVLHLALAFGSRFGMTTDQAAARTPTTYAVEAIMGVAALAAAAGAAMLASRKPARRRLGMPVVLAWVGAGAMFSWGFWSLLNTIAVSMLSSGATAEELVAVSIQTLGGALVAATVIATASAAIRHAAEAAYRGSTVGAPGDGEASSGVRGRSAGDAYHQEHQAGGE